MSCLIPVYRTVSLRPQRRQHRDQLVGKAALDARCRTAPQLVDRTRQPFERAQAKGDDRNPAGQERQREQREPQRQLAREDADDAVEMALVGGDDKMQRRAAINRSSRGKRPRKAFST